MTHSPWPTRKISHDAVALLQVGVPLRVLWGYSAATACLLAPVTVASDYSQSTLKGSPTCNIHRSTSYWNLHSRSKKSGWVGEIWVLFNIYIQSYQIEENSTASMTLPLSSLRGLPLKTPLGNTIPELSGLFHLPIILLWWSTEEGVCWISYLSIV